jgi:hypothetical protein
MDAAFFNPLPTTEGKAMEIKHILIIMFVVFGLFMLANWFNRPKGPRK